MTIICPITSKIINNNDSVIAIPLDPKPIFHTPKDSYLEYDSFYSISDFPYTCTYYKGDLQLESIKVSLYHNLHMVVLPEVYNFLASREKENPSLRKSIWERFRKFREHEFKHQKDSYAPDTYYSMIYTPFDLFSVHQMDVPKYRELILGKDEPLELLESYIRLKYFLFNLTKIRKTLVPVDSIINQEGVEIMQHLNKLKT